MLEGVFFLRTELESAGSLRFLGQESGFLVEVPAVRLRGLRSG
jgi:hypothetical protein